jgi:hypothetical protein
MAGKRKVSNLSQAEQDSLQEAMDLKEMFQSKGFQVFKEHLTVKLNQSFPDPQGFEKIEDFTYAAMATSAMKKAAAEILLLEQQTNDRAEALLKKEKGEVEQDNFAIGT